MQEKSIIRNIKKRARRFLITESFISYTGLLHYYFHPFSKSLISLKIKGIKNKIFIRKNSRTDRNVLKYVFHERFGQYHLPPKDINLPDNCTIIDIGCNIGLTVVHFKNLYPDSIVIGYEMDSCNFELAKKNCEKYDHVLLYNEAVWTSTGKVNYSSNTMPDGFSVVDGGNFGEEKLRTVKSITLSEIIQKNQLTKIDYLKMDIEGAEKNIFKAPDLSWMAHVHLMNIEIHGEEMKAQDYIQILEANGFKAWKDSKHWSAVFAQKIIL